MLKNVSSFDSGSRIISSAITQQYTKKNPLQFFKREDAFGMKLNAVKMLNECASRVNFSQSY